MRIAALGRTHWLRDAVLLARSRGHEIALIATCPAAPEYTVTESDYQLLAEELGVPFLNQPLLDDERSLGLLSAAEADVALSVNWLTRLPNLVLDRFPLGVLNAHAGDLPRYRGNAAPNWAIIAREPEVVFTIHQMSEELDAGPIILQERMPLDDTVYIGEVYERATERIPMLLVDAAEGLNSGLLTPRPQPADPALSLRTFPRIPSDSRLDWTRPAVELAAIVRASSEPFAGAYTDLNGERLTIWRAHPAELPYPWLGAPGQVATIDPNMGTVTVLTGENVLVLEEVGDRDGRRLSATSCIRSPRTRLGLDHERSAR